MPDRYRSARARDAVAAECTRRLDAWPVPHERCVVSTRAGTTHVLVAGRGPRTVVYLPGTNFNAATSLPLLAQMASEARVVAPDLPGQPGLSTGRRPAGGVSGYGAWAAEVLAWAARSLGAVRPVLAGHSLGAAVALAVPPAAVSALLAVSPAGLIRLRLPPALLGATAAWLLRPSEAGSARLVAQLTADSRADAGAAAWMTLVARCTWPAAAPGPLPREVTDRWRGVPVAVVCGAADVFLPPAALEPAVRSRLGVPLTVLDGTGHLCVEEDPAAVVRTLGALTDRLADLPTRATD